MRSSTPNEFSEDDDDGPEIEVIPGKPMPLPRNVPAARSTSKIDEIVESGEIVERRSRVIRTSGGMPIAEIKEETTEKTRLAQGTVAPPRRQLRVLWLVAAVVPAIAAFGLSFVERSASTRQGTMAVEAAAEMIGTALDAEARAAVVRVEAIASSSMLRAGIETDAATLADMWRDQDLKFPVDRGERLEVFQVRDGKRTSMLRIPPDAAPIAVAEDGKTRVEPHGDGIAVVATSKVARQQSGIGGEIVISVPIDLDPIKRRVAGQAKRASLVGFDTSIVLVPGDGSSTGTSVTFPIATKLELQVGLSLAALMAPPATGGNGIKIARYACFGLSGLLLLAFVASLARGRKPAAS